MDIKVLRLMAYTTTMLFIKIVRAFTCMVRHTILFTRIVHALTYIVTLRVNGLKQLGCLIYAIFFYIIHSRKATIQIFLLVLTLHIQNHFLANINLDHQLRYMAFLLTITHFNHNDENNTPEQAPKTTFTEIPTGSATATMSSPLPPTTSPTDSSLASSRASSPKDPSSGPNTHLIQRITSIRALLTEIQISVDNRELLLKQAANSREYHITSPRNASWKVWAQNQNRRFYALQAQVECIGDAATVEKILEWERKVERLRRGTLNQVDRFDAENAWVEFKEDEGKVLTPGWNWVEAAAKGGPGLDDEPVCPLASDMPNPHEDAGQYSHLDSGKVVKYSNWR